MRKATIVVSVIVTVAAAFELGRLQVRGGFRPETKARQVVYYVDPMHPGYKSDKPGTAPDCGMPLVPVYAGGSGTRFTPSPPPELPPESVSLDVATRQLLGIQLASVERSAVTRIVHAAGRVAPEDTRVYRINAGVDGFIRDTFHDSVGTSVNKEQILATYYAPDFLAVASGFLAATERVPGAVGPDGSRTMPFPGALSKQGISSVQGYTDRLRNLGMSEVQIRRIAETRQLPETIDVVAPVSGFILARNVSPGQHFEHAMEFYRIADLADVWVVAELAEQDLPYVRGGASAAVVLREEGRRLPARVSESLPQSEAGGSSVKLRLEVENPGYALRPDMVVDVELPIRMPPAITVPVDAVVDSGSRTRVYVDRGQDVFEPRDVQTGWRSGERIQILQGLQPGEHVVAAATFLIDSESRLKPTPPPHTSGRPLPMPQRVALHGPESAGGRHGHGDD